MCLADLYDHEPKRREKVAILENAIRMRDSVREVDAIHQFMPAAAVDVSLPSPCAEAAAAGAYKEKAA